MLSLVVDERENAKRLRKEKYLEAILWNRGPFFTVFDLQDAKAIYIPDDVVGIIAIIIGITKAGAALLLIVNPLLCCPSCPLLGKSCRRNYGQQLKALSG